MDAKPRTVITILLGIPVLLCFVVTVVILLNRELLLIPVLLLWLYSSQTTAAPLPSLQNVITITGGLAITTSLFLASTFTKGKTNWIITIALFISVFALCIGLFAIARLK